MCLADKILLSISSVSLFFLLSLFLKNVVTPIQDVSLLKKDLIEVVEYNDVPEHGFKKQNINNSVNKILETSKELQKITNFKSVVNLQDSTNLVSLASVEGGEISEGELKEVLDDYFQGIKVNPEEKEEVERLIDFGDGTNLETLEEKKASSKEKESNLENKKKSLYQTHIVRKGDSVWRLSKKYKISMYTILSANPKIRKDILSIRQKLRIPSLSGIVYRVKKNDTLWDISKKYSISLQKIKIINSLSSTKLRIGESLFLAGVKKVLPSKVNKKRKFQLYWPIYGRITSHYGVRIHPIYKKKHMHKGIDIAAFGGTPVHAAAAGVVIFSGYRQGYGNMIILRHRGEYYTVYGHLLKVYKKKNEYVSQLVRIGTVGNTGNTTGYHLHFELRKGKKTINPNKFLINSNTQRRTLAFHER